MRIVFAGSPQVSIPVLDFLLDSPHEVLAVLSRPDAPAGRGRRMTASAVAQRATENNLPLYQPRTLRNNEEAVSFLRDLSPDLGVIVAYGSILPPEVLSIPKHGWINAHFSLLPRWRGAAPVQRAVQAGDTAGGITVFQLEDGPVDTGPIFCTTAFEFPDQFSAGQILDELSKLSPQTIQCALEAISSGISPVPQSEDGLTHAPQLKPDEGEIDWSLSASRIHNHVRGFTPSPGAWTTFQGKRLKVRAVSLDSTLEMPVPVLKPGEIFPTRTVVWVGTGTAPVCLVQVAPAGKKHMSASDWARGARLETGMVLGE